MKNKTEEALRENFIRRLANYDESIKFRLLEIEHEAELEQLMLVAERIAFFALSQNISTVLERRRHPQAFSRQPLD